MQGPEKKSRENREKSRFTMRLRSRQIDLPVCDHEGNLFKGNLYPNPLPGNRAENLAVTDACRVWSELIPAVFRLKKQRRSTRLRVTATKEDLDELLYGVDTFFKDYPEAIIGKESELYADNGNPMMKSEFSVPCRRGENRKYRATMILRVYKYDYKRIFLPEKMILMQGRT